MAKKTVPDHKKEPLFASDLASASLEARLLFLQRAARSAPGFAFELSAALPPGAVFEKRYDRSSYHSHDVCAFEGALASGHFALARLWAARQASVSRSQRELASDRFASRPAESLWISFAASALKSSRSDDQLWRARPWMRKCATGQSLDSISPMELSREAIGAFCSGRPKLGLMCAQGLLDASPEELAQITASAHEWSYEVTAELWAKSGEKRAEFARSLDALFEGGHGRAQSNAHPKLCGLLSHLSYWALATQDSQPALSKELAALEQALWERGAFASPTVHAERFALAPYGADDPRAILCVSGAPQSSGEGSFHNANARGALFAALLARAAAKPDQSGRDAKTWDAFTHAHAGAEQANPNPFATWGSGCAALLSLCGDGRLIEIGAERAFDPTPAQWILVHPSCMLKAFSRKSLPAPTIQKSLLTHTLTLLPSGFGAHTPKPHKSPAIKAALAAQQANEGSAKKSKKKAPLIREGDLARGVPKPSWGRDPDASDWTYQSLASVALCCGLSHAARALGKAGAPAATLTKALEEATGLEDRRAISEIYARFEMESLHDSTSETDKPRASSRSALRV